MESDKDIPGVPESGDESPFSETLIRLCISHLHLIKGIHPDILPFCYNFKMSGERGAVMQQGSRGGLFTGVREWEREEGRREIGLWR